MDRLVICFLLRDSNIPLATVQEARALDWLPCITASFCSKGPSTLAIAQASLEVFGTGPKPASSLVGFAGL